MVVELETKLKWELMMKKLEVYIKVVVISVAATTATALAWKFTMEKENDIMGEISLKVISIIFWFAGLLQEEMIRIF